MMEVFLYNSNVCRLCGEENDNGSLLYSSEENNQNLSDIINAYLPIRVSDDGQLPRTICPGCTIQLEATVEFLNLIINGQKIIRELHEREKEYSKSILKSENDEADVITENIVYEINTSDGVYQVEHPISLQVAGLDKPKRKRGRPPKKPKTPEELAAEAAAKEQQAKMQTVAKDMEESSGKRRRKTPTRFKEVVQGAELERIFKEEGVTDGEESEPEMRQPPSSREPEVIGHLEASGELVLFAKGKGRGRPRGRMRQTREQCVICGMEFSCLGRYMSHVAQHGPVRYRCSCEQEFPKRLHFNDHQRETGHTGLTVIPCPEAMEATKTKPNAAPVLVAKDVDKAPDVQSVDIIGSPSRLPELESGMPQPKHEIVVEGIIPNSATPPSGDCPSSDLPPDPLDLGPESSVGPAGKKKLQCNHCDKLFSNKQSKSLHIKAVHQGERPYVCRECGATFAYPRSLALHAVTHRRRRAACNGYACDLCGKILNHPSSVVYHKQSAHAAEQYVCGACGKRFRHKQLLQRHQLVHSQARPFSCKICTATFKTKANLLNHQLLHYGVKKFSCEICKHRFAHKTSLTLHMRWHAGVKPFSCEVCGKSFSQKGNLSEHERIHTGEKPYACVHCPRRFTTSSQHRLHTRRHLRARSKQTRRLSTHKCTACSWTGASRVALAQHARDTGHTLLAGRKQNQKQESLLVSERGSEAESPALSAPQSEAEEERVIYVAYDMDDADSPAYHILDPEQGVSLEDSKAMTGCELYSGSSLLMSQQLEQVVLAQQVPVDQDLQDLETDQQQVEFEQTQHLPVTDEQGNPLHFTMQDGTRLAITSADGKSLQVITQDGQTIPVEINGFTDEDELDPDTVVHQLNIQKGGDGDSPVAHYFTLV